MLDARGAGASGAANSLNIGVVCLYLCLQRRCCGKIEKERWKHVWLDNAVEQVRWNFTASALYPPAPHSNSFPPFVPCPA
eukprot:1717685-Pyramimonas_sp.AAC.1